jgi:hypothetical protein
VGRALEALLRDLISRTSNSQDLEALRSMLASNHVRNHMAIDAAANLKEIRLHLKIDQIPSEAEKSTQQPTMRLNQEQNAPKPVLTKLSLSQLDPLPGYEHMVEGSKWFSTYRSGPRAKRVINSHFMLEWKEVPKHLEDKLKRRISHLTMMMSNISDAYFTASNA